MLCYFPANNNLTLIFLSALFMYLERAHVPDNDLM